MILTLTALALAGPIPPSGARPDPTGRTQIHGVVLVDSQRLVEDEGVTAFPAEVTPFLGDPPPAPLLAGDRVLMIEGVPVRTRHDYGRWSADVGVRLRPGASVLFWVLRGGRVLPLRMDLIAVPGGTP